MSRSTTDYLNPIFYFVPTLLFMASSLRLIVYLPSSLDELHSPDVKQHSLLPPRGVFSTNEPDPSSLECRSANVATEVDSGYGRKTSFFEALG